MTFVPNETINAHYERWRVYVMDDPQVSAAFLPNLQESIFGGGLAVARCIRIGIEREVNHEAH